MDLRDTFEKAKTAVVLVAVVAVPLSFCSGLVTDNQTLPSFFKSTAGVVIDVPNDVGVWVRRTAVPFVIGLGN